MEEKERENINLHEELIKMKMTEEMFHL